MTGLNIGVIIQARMGSTRLPGKVMKLLGNKPVLWHVIERIKYSELVNEIIIATTNSAHDKVIVDFCINNDIKYYCGSEEDVLDRYFNAAKKFQLDAVIRVTSDCPLIDPKVIDELVETFIENQHKAQYVTNSIIRSYPRGQECSIFSMNALKISWNEATEVHQREHVVLYIRENPKKFGVLNIENEKDLSNFRWTLDTEEDYLFLSEIYDNLYESNKIITTKAVLSLLERKPHLININNHIKQKER